MNSKPLVFITGPGRCGTSLLAHFCLLNGHDPGGSWFDGADCGYECDDVRAINLRIMKSPANFTVEQLHRIAQRYRVVKDCYLFRRPDVLKAWLDDLDVSLIVCWRDPRQQGKSWLRKNYIESEAGMLEPFDKHWTVDQYVAWTIGCRNRFMEGMKGRGSFWTLNYPEFLNAFDVVYDTFVQAGLEMKPRDEAETIWEELVDNKKVHFK